MNCWEERDNKMNLAKNLAAEIKKLDERRATLADDVERARGELDASRDGFVSGKSDVSQVTVAQSTYSALSEALATLDARITEKRGQLEEARDEEQRQQRAARIAELRGEQERLQNEYDQVRAEASETVGKAAAKMIELGQKFHAATKEISDLSPASPSTAISRERGLTDKPLQFGELLLIAARILWNEEDRLRRKEMSRALTERERQREVRRASVKEAA